MGAGLGNRPEPRKVANLGAPFVCFHRKIDGDSGLPWWFNHPPGPSISPKRTPMVATRARVADLDTKRKAATWGVSDSEKQPSRKIEEGKTHELGAKELNQEATRGLRLFFFFLVAFEFVWSFNVWTFTYYLSTKRQAALLQGNARRNLSAVCWKIGTLE